ncbi:hypothetical protein CLOSCI_03012 [[Clostridium] scindens ATCC 35704]|nr:hypothetical protein CLOSCI_03012 [[Clostridium] scindens ATCC 35704]BDF18460.1 hypothetical protein CE91St60_00430 [[Clostridium] scindens]
MRSGRCGKMVNYITVAAHLIMGSGRYGYKENEYHLSVCYAKSFVR